MVAAVVLLVTGRYPEQIFDFVLGLNRWVLRVAAYAGLMTDQYPPFRLDMGGHDPGTLTLPQPPTGQSPRRWHLSSRDQLRSGRQGGPPAGSSAVVAGAVLTLCSLGLLGAGAPPVGGYRGRHAGYVDLGTATYSVPAATRRQRHVGLHASGHGGTRRRPARHGPHPRHTSQRGGPGLHRHRPGRRCQPATCPAWPTRRSPAWPASVACTPTTAGPLPRCHPARAGIWTIQAAGAGTQTLTWRCAAADWMVVAMNADGSRPVSVQVNVAATLPALPWIATGLLIGGIIVLGAGALLIAIPARGASRRPAPAATTGAPPLDEAT